MRTPSGHRRVPQLTGRDGDALRWCGEMYACRSDVLGVLLGRLSPAAVPSGYVTDRVVRRVVARWERAGLVRSMSLLGRQWAVPTERGLAYAGLVNGERGWVEWQPSKPRLGHVHACGVVRLWAEAQGIAWRSERWLRREPEADQYTLHDGLVTDAAGKRWAVEVELTQKSDANLQPVLARVRPEVGVVVYFTPSGLAARVAVQLDRVAARVLAEPGLLGVPRVPELLVRPLPEVPGCSYEGRW